MRLRVEGLGWRAKAGAIVQDVSFELGAGQTLGVVGPNGSGKSTLLRLLAGLLPRPEGRVMLGETPLCRLSRREIAQRVAFVEQQAETSEALTLRQAVEMGRMPWLSMLRPFGPDDHAIVARAMAKLDLCGLAGRNWAHLSGGERQRGHIARALAQEPQVLLLDEPTNHLDIRHQLALIRLTQTLPITVVVALHDLNQALSCDQLAVMAAGRLVAYGPPRAVLTPARLAQVFGVGARALHDHTDASTLLRFHCLTAE